MCMPLEAQLQGELTVSKLANCELCKQLVKEQEKNTNLETRHKMLQEFIEDFTQQINRSIMAENQILTVKLDGINKLLKDLLHKIIKEHCIVLLENNDDSNIIHIEAQLALIRKIIDEVEKI